MACREFYIYISELNVRNTILCELYEIDCLCGFPQVYAIGFNNTIIKLN